MTAGKIDPAVVRRHLLALETVLDALESHRGKPIEALSAVDERWIVERGLQLAAQNVLDVTTHLVAGSGRDAADYTSAIAQLSSIGAISPELAIRIRPLAGFRNVLVHGYLAIDLAIVHSVLNSRMDELREFAAHVERFLTSTE